MNKKTILAILNVASFVFWLVLAVVLLGSKMSSDSIFPLIGITALYVLGMLGFVLMFRQKLDMKVFVGLMTVFDLIYIAFFIYFAFY